MAHGQIRPWAGQTVWSARPVLSCPVLSVLAAFLWNPRPSLSEAKASLLPDPDTGHGTVSSAPCLKGPSVPVPIPHPQPSPVLAGFTPIGSNLIQLNPSHPLPRSLCACPVLSLFKISLIKQANPTSHLRQKLGAHHLSLNSVAARGLL